MDQLLMTQLLWFLQEGVDIEGDIQWELRELFDADQGETSHSKDVYQQHDGDAASIYLLMQPQYTYIHVVDKIH